MNSDIQEGSYPYLNAHEICSVGDNSDVRETWNQSGGKKESDVLTDQIRPNGTVKHDLDKYKHDRDTRKRLLPPCVVCGVTSSGFHYGANTCEACKGFFRRNSMKTEVAYKCKCQPEVQDSWKRGFVKEGCQACRFKRCLVVGMSKEAIKLGRYTYRHKTENIKHAKYIEAMSKGNDAGYWTRFSSSCPPSSTSIPPSETNPFLPAWTPLPAFETDDFIGSYDRISPMKSSVRKVLLHDTHMTRKEMDVIIDKITAAHLNSIQTIDTPIETIKRKQAEYLELYKTRGDNQLYTDANIKMSQVANIFKVFEEKVVKAVAFAKNIPGFRELHLDDQASLIKASRVEMTLFDAYKYLVTHIDTERMVMTSPWKEELHLEEVNQLIPLNNVIVRYNFAKRLSDLRLTSREISIFRAIITTASDRSPLVESDKVDALQLKLVTCLQHLLNIRSRGSGSMLYKIFTLMTDLRELTEVESELSRKMLSDWPMVSRDNFFLLKELSS